jgi:hypothetical protein
VADWHSHRSLRVFKIALCKKKKKAQAAEKVVILPRFHISKANL